jgi:hypothetical protein
MQRSLMNTVVTAVIMTTATIATAVNRTTRARKLQQERPVHAHKKGPRLA